MIQRFESFVTGISACYKYIQRIKSQEMTELGLKGTHVMCIFYLHQNESGLTASQLCRLCAEDKAAISRTLSELEQAGMILRQDRNGTRYRASLTLTEQGRAAADAVSEKARLAVELAGTGLEDAQREIFYQVLGLIAGNLHTICRDGLKKEE